jgi:cilia- and flagella-associated protein 69
MSQVSLEKTIELMTSRHTAQIKDRHASMIRRVCSSKSVYADGFPYKELDLVIQIIQLLQEGIRDGSDELIDPLARLITHCRKDFKKEKMSDEFIYAPKLAEFLESLTPIFKSEIGRNPELIISLCGLVSEIAQKDLELFKSPVAGKKNITQDLFEENPMNSLKKKGTKYLQAISQTTIPEGLVHILADNVNHYEISAQTVQTISALSIYEPLAKKIGDLGALKDLIVVVCNAPSFRDPLVNICIECIWNILEQSGEESIRSLAREELLLSLRWTLQKVIREGYKLTDRKLRNEIMILITSVVACAETHYFLLSKDESAESFLEELVRYGSYDEINLASAGSSIKPMWSTEIEDLEFKKLVWTAICRAVSSGIPDAIKLVENSDFLPALLLYLDPSQNNQTIARWEDPEVKELQIHTLQGIFHILPLFQEHFQQQNGNYCLVHFLSTYSDIDRKVATLKALEIASQCADFKLELAEEGLFDTLLDIVQSEADYPLLARELALAIVSNACRDCRDNQKEIRRKGWIEVLKTNLKPLLPTVNGEPDQFLLSLLDCLWNAVLANKRSLLHFIDIEGISAVLDFLDDCLEVHRRVVISCLCKLLKVQRGKSSFTQWNSRKDMANAPQLLIRIYEQEEERLGITYSEDRVLKDPQRPLAYTEPRTTKGFDRLREALEEAEKQSEMSVLRKKQLDFVRKRDLRASIFCCLSQVGFDSNELTPQERQKMEVIRMYPDFRKGELFLDIKNELEALGIRPTSDDRYWLQQCLDEALEQASNTIKNQSLIAREHKRDEEQALSEFYQTILKSGVKNQG